jgi:hypothetical protein
LDHSKQEEKSILQQKTIKNDQLIREMAEYTGCNNFTAYKFLSKNRWDINAAINQYVYENQDKVQTKEKEIIPQDNRSQLMLLKGMYPEESIVKIFF